MKVAGLRDARKLCILLLLISLLCPMVVRFIPSDFHISASASPDPVMAVDPVTSTAEPGEYFTINFTISEVENLYQWSFELWWDVPKLLDIDKTNVTEGDFLKAGGNTQFSKNVFTSSGFYITAACSLQGTPGPMPWDPHPQNGSGWLGSATFKVKGPGSHALELREVSLKCWNWTSSSLYEVIPAVEHGAFYTTTPYSKFTYSPDPAEAGNYGRPIVGETVTFNASESYDPDGGTITSFEWDFDDGNVTTVSDPIITHIYDENATYLVRLNVTDDDTQSYSWERFVKINLHDIAVIDVIATPTEVLPSGIVEINATVLNEGNFEESLNVTVCANDVPVNTTMFTWYRWIPLPEGGGHWTLQTSLKADENGTTTLSWNTTGFPGGVYTISVNASIVYPVNHPTHPLEPAPGLERDLTDNTREDGDVSIVVHDVAITSVTCSPTTATIGDIVSIDVTASNPGDFSETFDVTAYYGNIPIDTKTVTDLSAGGDTNLNFSWNTSLVAEGVYTVKANASVVPDETEFDNNEYIFGDVTVEKAPGAPIANFTYTPESPMVNQEVTFNSTSYDEDGNIDSWQWDFNGDHITDATTENATWTYTTAGNYTVTLTVIDDDALPDNTYQYILVKAPPSANFTYTPEKPVVNEIVNFNASSSTPDGGTITSYQWDFGDDTPVVTESDPIANHTYTVFGNYTVILNVTDNEGLWSTLSKNITAYARPVADFTYSPTEPITNQIVTFNASASDDPDGHIVSYKWDFGDGNITTVANPIIYHTYTENGTHTVTLNVTDNDGLTDTTTDDVTVSPPILIHDVAITDVTANPTTVAPGQYVSVIVDVENEGDFAETFNVTAHYDTSDIGVKTVTLNPNATTTLTFTWNTAIVAEGTYTISAEADAVPGETDLEDNAYIDDTVTIVRQVGPGQTLSIEFSGEREYFEGDDVKIRLVALVRYADTMMPASNANVTIRIFDPEGELWISGVMVEKLTGTGIYEWESIDTIAELELEKGFYLIHVQARLGGLEASEISQFRIATVQKTTSIISLDADPTSVTTGSSITLSGVIFPKRPGVSVTILYRPSGGTWSELRSVKTSLNGHYSLGWVMTTAGTYEVKASWLGDTRTEGAESEVETVTVQGSHGLSLEIPPYVTVAIAAVIGSIVGSIVGSMVLMRIRKPKSA